MTMMSLLCLFGRHVPSAVSLARRRDGAIRAHCDHCAVPLEQHNKGAWKVAAPLAERRAN
jgi:hypothetical protein